MVKVKSGLSQKKIIIFLLGIFFISSILFTRFWLNYLFWFTYPTVLVFLVFKYFYNLNKASLLLQELNSELYKKVSRDFFFGRTLINTSLIKSDKVKLVSEENFQVLKRNVRISFKFLIITMGVFFLNLIIVQIIILIKNTYE